MNFILSIFEKKYAAIACILIALANRIINVLFVSFPNRDKMVLVLQSKNFLEGHGLSRNLYDFNTPDLPVYDLTPMWPPGYPVLLSPFLKLFDYNIYWATTTLDIITCLALIFIIRKLCRQMGFSNALINIATLIAGCFEYSFINESQPTDTISLVLLLLGISFLLRLISNKNSAFLLIATGIVLFSPCLFRYNYVPVSLIIPLLILLAGVFKKDNSLKRKGWGLLFVNAVLIVTLFFSLKMVTGHAGYMIETERGFYPENIIHWLPVAPSSFINIAFLLSQLTQKLNISFSTGMLMLEVLNLITVLTIITFILFAFLKKKIFAPITTLHWFGYIGFGICAVIFISLGYLSLTYHIQETPGAVWNYINEPRYFAFINIFLQLCLLGMILRYSFFKRNIFYKSIVFACSLLLFIEITHNLYFHTKVALNYNKYKAAVYREQDYKYFNNLLPGLAKDHPGKDIFVATSVHDYYTNTASYYGYRGIENAESLKAGQPAVKKASVLLFVISDIELKGFEKCLQGDNVSLLKNINSFNFFLIKLNP
jgi:hypothetical protein